MSKKQLKVRAEKSLDYLDEVRRSYDYRNIYCTNVKRYGDFVDIEDIAKEYPKRIKEAIVEEFTDEHIGDIYQSWLEFEGQHFCEDFLGGCSINSPEHYQKLRKLVNADKDTGYPAIERKKTVSSKLATIDKWDKSDRKIRKHLSYIDLKSAGLYGRSGGWFGIHSAVAEKLESLIWDIDNGYTADEIYANNDVAGMFEEVRAIKWVLNEADRFNKGLNFETELRFRVEEFVDEEKINLQREKEIKTARTLASKYGYLIARAV